MLVHHDNKAGGQRGTSKREDVLSTVLQLRHPTDYQTNEGARFEVHLTKARSIHGTAAEPFEASLTTDRNGRSVWTWATIGDVKKSRVQRLWDEGETNQRAIANELGMGVGTVNRKIKALRAEGRIEG